MHNWFNKGKTPDLLYSAIALILLGLSLLVIDRWRVYTLVVDGQTYSLRTVAFTPRQVLIQAGYNPVEGDKVWPQPDQTNLRFTQILVDRQRPVTIITPTETLHFESAELLAANLLQHAKLKLFPGDIVEHDGVHIDPALTLEPGQEVILTFVPSKQLSVTLNRNYLVVYTQQPTLELALSEAGIALSENSVLSLPLDHELDQQDEVTIHTSRQVVVNTASGSTSGLTAAQSVGQALRDLSVPLQGLDRVQPPEAQPLPDNGLLALTHIEENLSFQTEETAYNNTYTEDPNAELDTISTIVPGQLGLVVTRTRSRIENGIETTAVTEGPWKASDPADGVLGWGTKPVVSTEVVDGETLEYWRKVSVYATGYTPSSQGRHTGTASGTPLTKGVIAVTVPWYQAMKFQKVYVSGYGYGTIADTGGGILGRYWIDLGFDDDNYVSWHSWTTMYFLTPIPAFFPTVLP
ncbi:MAG: ubiquitin-like domain-containing protein [Anaerolineaceae bacterium]